MKLEPTGPRLWQVNISAGKYVAARNEPLEGPAAVSPKQIAKDWNDLVKPRLNLAWLPPDQVFIRVVHLPKAESFAETISMLEFQLEKLSPLPAAQIVWTFEVVPSRGMLQTQTAVLVIVPRQAVEDLLGKLEGQSYLADRIELPFLDQLLGVEINRDCAILFPITTQEGGRFLWTAWWIGGVLQTLAQIHVPATLDVGEVIQAQIAQIIWAGELEGWLNTSPRYFLVADEASAAEWMRVLEGKFDPPLERIPAASDSSLVALSAKRAAQSDSKVGLLPAEFTARYRQLFLDKLWMQSLFGILACYLFGLLIYFAIVAVKGYQRDKIFEQEIVQGNSYTNSIKLRDQVRVLQDQINLQFSALNCYLAVATNLPSELTLESMNFDRGTKLVIYGNGSPESANKVYDFVGVLKRARGKDAPLFESIDGPAVNVKPGGGQVAWNLSANIHKAESE